MTDTTPNDQAESVEAEVAAPLPTLEDGAPQPIEISYDYPIVCVGQGPHDPPDGVIAHSDIPQDGRDMGRCKAPICAKPVDPTITNQATLQNRLQAAFAANTTYLAIGSPTAAQTTAWAQKAAKQLNALIKLALGQLDDTTGT